MRRKPKSVKYLILRKGYWCIHYVHGDTRVRKATGFRKDELDKAIEKRDVELRPYLCEKEVDRKAEAVKNLMTAEERLAAARDALPAMTLRDAWDAFEIAPKGKTARGRVIAPGARTMADYKTHWTGFCNWLDANYAAKDGNGEGMSVEMRAVTPDQAQGYIAKVGKERSANTRNKVLAFLRLMFKVLAEQARIKANPFDGLDAVPLAMVRKRPLTAEELRAVSALLEGKGEMDVLFAFGYYAGARLGDCVAMRWDMIDMGARKIRYTPHKTRKSNEVITITIHPTLFGLLDRTPKNQRRGYVMPEMAAVYARDPAALTKRIQKVFQDAGIETGVEVDGYSRQVAIIGFHSLRHAHITALLEGGAPMESVRARVGHSTIGMTARYYHDSGEATERALQALPAFGQANGLTDATGATGAEMEGILVKLEGLGRSELERVGERVREMLGR